MRWSDNFVPFSDVPSRGALMISQPPESPYFDQIHLIGNSDCARCILHCSEFLRTVCTSFRCGCARSVNMPLFVNGHRRKREGYSKYAINGTMRCFGPSLDSLFPSRKNSLRWSWTRKFYCEVTFGLYLPFVGGWRQRYRCQWLVLNLKRTIDHQNNV